MLKPAAIALLMYDGNKSRRDLIRNSKFPIPNSQFIEDHNLNG